MSANWQVELAKARSVKDLDLIMQGFFGASFTDVVTAMRRLFAKITDPALRDLIDSGLKEELDAIRDEHVRQSRKEVLKNLREWELDKPQDEKPSDTRLYIYGRSNGEDAEYTVIEADDAQASHLPEQGFIKNPKYGLENERLYHKEQASQDKVIKNALLLNSDFLLRDSVDANNGAPVLDQDNNVLGGNSRVMSLRKAWQSGGKVIEDYRAALMKRARELGLDTEEIARMKQPILVRRLKTAYSKEERQQLVSALNDNFTDSKDKRMEGKSRGDRSSPKTLLMLGNAMREANTLRDYFDTPESLDMIEALIKDGVIKESDRNALLSGDGMLNPYGKNMVEDALRGRISQSYETLAKLPGVVSAKVDGIIPFVLIAESVGEKWAITRHISDALEFIVEFNGSPFRKDKNYTAFLNSPHMISKKTAAERYSKTSIQLALLLMDGKKREIADRFKRYASDAVNMSGETNSMFPITAKDSAKKHLGVVLEAASKLGIFENANDYDWRNALEQAISRSQPANGAVRIQSEGMEYGSPQTITIDIDTEFDSPQTFREIIRAIEQARQMDTLIIKINSHGGRTDSAQAIYVALLESKARTIAKVITAYSSGSIVTMACDEIQTTPHCTMMIHNASAMSWGKIGDMKAQSTFMENHFKKWFSELYAGFLTLEEIDDVFKGQDIWLREEDIKNRLANWKPIRQRRQLPSNIEEKD